MAYCKAWYKSVERFPLTSKELGLDSSVLKAIQPKMCASENQCRLVKYCGCACSFLLLVLTAVSPQMCFSNSLNNL